MVKIELDDGYGVTTTVEGDTLKIAQREAKKVLAKQKIKQDAKDARWKMARLKAQAFVGELAQSLDEDTRGNSSGVYPAHVPYLRGTPYGQHLFCHVKPGEHGDVLLIQTEDEKDTAEAEFSGYTIVALVSNGSGWLLAAKLKSKTPTEKDYYVAVSAHEGVAGWEQIPAYIGKALDDARAAKDAKEKKA